MSILAILSTVRAHWKLAVMSLLLALCAIQSVRLSNTQLKLTAEREGRASDREATRLAMLAAEANAKADKLKWENFYAAKAKAADTRATGLAADYRAAVLRFESDQRKARTALAAASRSSSAVADGPGGYPELPEGSILIPTNDALICATNTARLVSARKWALTLETPE